VVLPALITSAGIARGPVIHPVVAARLACDARIQVVAEDLRGEAIAMGRTSRVPSAAMMRQLKHRDREYTFPGCGATRFLVAHHLVFWSVGGTDRPADMALTCTCHHDYVHELGLDRTPRPRWDDPVVASRWEPLRPGSGPTNRTHSRAPRHGVGSPRDR
jgi:hypothetical protein